jgi:cyclophilin family peptidyl-prolyl cis-trans isomerase/protein-disulfide isomerase
MSKTLSFFKLILLAVITSACTSPTPTPVLIIPTLPPDLIIPAQAACTILPGEPTPGPDTPSIFPPVTSADHTRGTENAAMKILVYSDFQDPRSAVFAEITKQLLAEFPDDVFVASRPFPIFVINDKSAYAALAAEAAAEQGKYWEMHDRLFEGQAEWINLSVDDFKAWIVDQLPALELNEAQFKSDYSREDIIAKVQKAWEDGAAIQLPGTPVVVLNGDLYQGPRDYDSLRDITQLILLGKRQFATCPPVTVQATHEYTATLHTEKGDIILQLFADKAPYTVNSFIFLAQNGWYDNITFHRVIPKLYAQTGDPSGTGKGNPGYYVVTEIMPTLTFNTPGLVAMVNSGPDTSGSQFFITLAPIPQYDGQYTIFGRVLQGMDIVQALTPRDPQPGIDVPPGDKLLRIEINER